MTSGERSLRTRHHSQTGDSTHQFGFHVHLHFSHLRHLLGWLDMWSVEPAHFLCTRHRAVLKTTPDVIPNYIRRAINVFSLICFGYKHAQRPVWQQEIGAKPP
jgi:hypothetical protein